MATLQLADNEIYGENRGFLRISTPTLCVDLCDELGEILFLMVWTNEDPPNALYLTKEQAVQLRDYLNQVIEENQDND